MAMPKINDDRLRVLSGKENQQEEPGQVSGQRRKAIQLEVEVETFSISKACIFLFYHKSEKSHCS